MSVDAIASVGSRNAEDKIAYNFPANAEGKTRANQPHDDSEQAEIEALKKRDLEVRQHELAHISAGGSYVRGGASYSYQTGPDGQRYAIGGEVSIDASPVPDDPGATIKKMAVVQRAAMAPKDPSSQDYRVAAQARQAEMQARQELTQQQMETLRGDKSAGERGPNPQRTKSVDLSA